MLVLVVTNQKVAKMKIKGVMKTMMFGMDPNHSFYYK